MDHHIHEAKQNADGRLIPSLIFALGDYAALAVAGILAVYIRNCIMTYSTFWVSEGYLFLWLPLVFMFFNFYSGLYGRRMLIYRMVERLFFACLEGTVLGIILMFFAQVSGQVSRLFVVLYTILAFTLMAVLRVVLSKVMKRVKAFQIPVLIVGAGKTAALVVQQILRDSGMRYRWWDFWKTGILSTLPSMDFLCWVDLMIWKKSFRKRESARYSSRRRGFLRMTCQTSSTAPSPW